MIEDVSPEQSPVIAQTSTMAWPQTATGRLPPSMSMPSIDSAMNMTSSHKRPLSMSHETYPADDHKKTRVISEQGQQPSDERPWHAAFPSPTMQADVMPRERVLQILSMNIRSLLIIDVRRTDYEGGAIRGSLNVPAQGFFWNRGMLYELAYKAGMEWVVFTCGSSNGRGPRCAAWFLEWTRQVAADTAMQVLVLEGGIKGWVRAGPQYVQLMDGFDQAHWEATFRTEQDTAQLKATTDEAYGSTDGMEL